MEIEELGILIDTACDNRDWHALEKAVVNGLSLIERVADTEVVAIAHYYISNALADLWVLENDGKHVAPWEDDNLERQIVHLRKAILLSRGSQIDTIRVCQMHTNLGNLLHRCGRVVDAVFQWDCALSHIPEFRMAQGNKGSGLMAYARLTHDPGHQRILFRHAYANLKNALKDDAAGQVHPVAERSFYRMCHFLQSHFGKKSLGTKPHQHEWERCMCAEELTYRRWCLGARLFLNDLNDVVNDPIAAADALTLPPITTDCNTQFPRVFIFFNQIKQEYATARYFYYEGLQTVGLHFSDLDVKLANTLDYPVYGIAAEKLKTAFRMLYSIMDKVAFFVNDYLGLRIPNHKVSLRTIWYKKQKTESGMADCIVRPFNEALRGLYWLAKDIYVDDEMYYESIMPDARDVADLRNRLEHRFIQIVDCSFVEIIASENGDEVGEERFRYSRRDIEHKTMELMRLVRSAIILLTHVVYVHESNMKNIRTNSINVPMHVGTYDDNWKC